MGGIKCQPNVAVELTEWLIGGFARQKLSGQEGHQYHSCLSAISSSAWAGFQLGYE